MRQRQTRRRQLHNAILQDKPKLNDAKERRPTTKRQSPLQARNRNSRRRIDAHRSQKKTLAYARGAVRTQGSTGHPGADTAPGHKKPSKTARTAQDRRTRPANKTEHAERKALPRNEKHHTKKPPNEHPSDARSHSTQREARRKRIPK